MPYTKRYQVRRGDEHVQTAELFPSDIVEVIVHSFSGKVTFKEIMDSVDEVLAIADRCLQPFNLLAVLNKTNFVSLTVALARSLGAHNLVRLKTHPKIASINAVVNTNDAIYSLLQQYSPNIHYYEDLPTALTALHFGQA
jgi:hypothetical protein